MEHAESQVVQTCWATMALMYAGYPNPEPIEKAVKLVMQRQLPVRRSRLPCCVALTSRLLCFSFIGWFMGSGSYRGRVQQDMRYLVSQLQILIHDMDVG